MYVGNHCIVYNCSLSVCLSVTLCCPIKPCKLGSRNLHC